MVADVAFRYDPRFSLEENWQQCTDAVKEAQERGVLVTPLTVFSTEGKIVGWQLHGWKPPPSKFLYEPEKCM